MLSKMHLINLINNSNLSQDLGNQNQINNLDNKNLYLNNNFLIRPVLINNTNNSNNINNIIREAKLDNNNQYNPTNNGEKKIYMNLPYLNYRINNNILFKDNIQSKNANIENQKSKNDLNVHKKRGRIKKDENRVGNHDKYQKDNIIRKVKHLVLTSLKKFLNMKIKTLYKGKIGYNICKKEFLLLNKNTKYASSIEYNKQFIKKTLKEILSENISNLYTNYKPDFNKQLIERLVNENDKEKREYFIKIFNLTFLDCLQHFNRTKIIEEFDGMECFDEVLKEFNNEEEYKERLYYYIKNFDDILNRKKMKK